MEASDPLPAVALSLRWRRGSKYLEHAREFGLENQTRGFRDFLEPLISPDKATRNFAMCVARFQWFVDDKSLKGAGRFRIIHYRVKARYVSNSRDENAIAKEHFLAATGRVKDVVRLAVARTNNRLVWHAYGEWVRALAQ
jgi:hypothetical protein